MVTTSHHIVVKYRLKSYLVSSKQLQIKHQIRNDQQTDNQVKERQHKLCNGCLNCLGQCFQSPRDTCHSCQSEDLEGPKDMLAKVVA